MSNICIFGGTFDPPHSSHLNIIQHLQQRFKQVIVMPSGTPPHKNGTSSAHRLNMLRLCVEPSLINTLELDAVGKSYTALTLQRLAEQGINMPYLCIGGDSLLNLLSWHNPAMVMQLARLYVVPRPISGEAFKLEQMSQFLRVNYNAQIEIADIIGNNVSSTELRIRVAFNDYSLLNPAVADYIKQHGLYNEFAKYVNCLHRYNIKDRLQHTKNTAIMSAELAKLNNVDVADAVIGAILHDVGKNVCYEDAVARGFLQQNQLDAHTNVVHQYVGSAIAQHEFDLNEDILNAIRYHATGRSGMSQLEKVIFVADAVEMGREYSGVEELREAAFADLDAGAIKILKSQVQYLRSTGDGTVDLNKINALITLLEDKDG